MAKMSVVMGVAERMAPNADAEKWDNVGLLVGDPEQPVTRLLLTIDHTAAVQREAERLKCHAVVAYHPPIFSAVKRVTAGTVYFDALRSGMAVYCFHTALDVAVGGTNDALADELGLTQRVPLRTPAGATDGRGMGRVGTVASTTPDELAARLKEKLGLTHVLLSGERKRTVTRVAVCAGSCGEFLDDVIASGAQLFVTGELRHHDALKASSKGLTTLCTLHSNSERMVLPRLKQRFMAELPDVEVFISQEDADPFTFV